MPDERVAGPTSFLGTGWGFPPEFAPGTGGVLLASEEEDIRQSLEILFGTSRGERFLRPRYGVDLHEALFEPMSTTLKTYLEDRIQTSVLLYEPRVIPLKIQLDTSAQNEGVVVLVFDYEVRSTNSRFNLVVPFYAPGSGATRTAFGF